MVCIKMRLKKGGGGILSEFYKVFKMIISKGTNLHIIFGFVAPDRKEKITKILQTISNQGVFVKGVLFLKNFSFVIYVKFHCNFYHY